MRIKKNTNHNRIIVKASKQYVRAAELDEDDSEFDDFGQDDTDGLLNAIDDVADNVEDLQDSIDDMDEDATEIAVNNNIADHYIAECDQCNGVFISAVVESDQDIQYVSGICPLCGKETEQYLKWIIRSMEDE